MKCGICTVCCTMSVVPELKKGAGEDCIHCDRGCKIYDERPQSCKDFNCAWVQREDNFSTLQARKEYMKLRPDKCGIMFFKIDDATFSGAVAPGKKITRRGRQQINAFKEQGFSVIMLKIGYRPYIFPVEGRNPHQIYREYVENLKQSQNGNV